MHSKRKSKVMPAISLKRKKKRTKSVHLHHHLHHHHHYHFGSVSSQQAPRASPEDSDVGSSPAGKHKLVLPPRNGSATSLQSVNYCPEKMSKLEPLPLCQGQMSSPYMTTSLSIHRASSINYPTTNSKDQAVTFAKMASDNEGSATPTQGNGSPNKFQDKWSEIRGGAQVSKYSKLPPINTEPAKGIPCQY